MAPIEQHEKEGPPPRVPKKSDEIARAELREIVESRTFSPSRRLARFLRFIVESYLDGETERLKETVIGVEVYDRPPDYDPKVDSIVRTEARRLRKRLDEYYETEGRYTRIIISIRPADIYPKSTCALKHCPPLL